jgi:purine-nucleoside phosphorylase
LDSRSLDPESLSLPGEAHEVDDAARNESTSRVQRRAAADSRGEALARAIFTLRSRLGIRPQVAVIAGSGLSRLADRMENAERLPFETIKGWPRSTVAGHAGALFVGRLGGKDALVAAGRAHLYEGYDAFDASFNVRVFQGLGVKTLVVTNAAGGLNEAYAPGEIMILEDHLFLPGMVGLNPLVGPNDDSVGPRFPVLAGAYDLELQALAQRAAQEAGLPWHGGVYAMVAGPSYETPAEARFLKAVGADAVGMSTAPEVVVARHAGMRVLGISLITNRVLLAQPSFDLGDEDLHAEVTDVGAAAAPALAGVIEGVIRAMGSL